MMNKTIVIVGASRGIGRAIVEQLSIDPKLKIYALSRNIEALHQHFGRLNNVYNAKLDLTQNIPQQLQSIFQEEQHIDVLINNAGYLVNKPFDQLSPQDFGRSYQINVIGVMQTVQFLLPKLAKGSHVVNISSMGAFQGTVKFAGLTTYSSSKAALVNFTELFAEEYKNTDIKMNCLCLGAVQTEMFAEAFPQLQAPIDPKHMAEYICNFALNAHKWMNGKIIPVSLSTP